MGGGRRGVGEDRRECRPRLAEVMDRRRNGVHTSNWCSTREVHASNAEIAGQHIRAGCIHAPLEIRTSRHTRVSHPGIRIVKLMDQVVRYERLELLAMQHPQQSPQQIRLRSTRGSASGADSTCHVPDTQCVKCAHRIRRQHCPLQRTTSKPG